MSPSRSILALLALAAFAVCVFLFTWTRTHRDEARPGMPPVVETRAAEPSEPRSTVMVAGVALERLPPPTAAQETADTRGPDARSAQLDPRVLRGNEFTFKSAQELEHDPAVNSRHVVLTSEQRKQLQDLLTKAEREVSTAIGELQLAVNEHGRKMIDQGLGWDVPPGQLARTSDPNHTSIFSTYSPEKGTRAFSFDAKRDPETAPQWGHKEAVIDDYSKRITTFFGSL